MAYIGAKQQECEEGPNSKLKCLLTFGLEASYRPLHNSILCMMNLTFQRDCKKNSETCLSA